MKLFDYIAQRLNTPFCYGVNDCILFTVGWLEHATGIKYLPSEITWSSEKKALAELKKRGGIENIFDNHFKRIEPNFASDGDIALVDGVASIFSGAHCVSVGSTGLRFQNRTLAQIAWRIECQK